MNEVYNLERQTALENRIDPTGKKWTIHANRETALVHARPDPDRSDAVIPRDFSGQWTSATVLKEKIDIWLSRQWEKAELAQKRNDRTEQAAKEQARQKTVEESLAELDPEITDALGDLLDVKEESKEEASEAGEAIREVASDEVSKPESTEAVQAKENYTELNYQQLLEVAKERGITAKKKVDILAALNA